MRILLVKLSALGDIIQTLPALALLKRELPFAEMDWVVEERNAQLLLHHPYINQLLIFKKSYFTAPEKLFKFIQNLRSKKYTAVIDFQGLLKSALITFFARSKYKIGFSNHREGSPFFYNIKFSPYPPDLHAVKRYILLAKKSLLFLSTGKEIEPEEETIPRNIPLPESAPQFFESKKPFLILIPSARWKSKLWPFEYWEKFLVLSEDLREVLDFYFVGGKEEELKSFTEEMSRKYKGVISWVGKTSLTELAYLMKRCKAVISVDTGTMHLASLLNKPIIALFGPTSEQRTGPWSEKFLVLKENLPCQPCFKRDCATKSCLYELKPERVYLALKEFLRILEGKFIF